MNKIIEQLKNWFNSLFTEKETAEQEAIQETEQETKQKTEQKTEINKITFPSAEEATRQTYDLTEQERRQYIMERIQLGIDIRECGVHLKPPYVTEALLEELREAGYTIIPPERNMFGEYYIKWPKIEKK